MYVLRVIFPIQSLIFSEDKVENLNEFFINNQLVMRSFRDLDG